MDTDRATHKHVLWSLSNLVPVCLKEVSTLQSLEPEEVVIVITCVVNFGIDCISIIHYVLESTFTQEGSWSACLVNETVQLLCHVTDVSVCTFV